MGFDFVGVCVFWWGFGGGILRRVFEVCRWCRRRDLLFESFGRGDGDGSDGRHGRARAGEGGGGADDCRFQRRSKFRHLRSPRPGSLLDAFLVDFRIELGLENSNQVDMRWRMEFRFL